MNTVIKRDVEICECIDIIMCGTASTIKKLYIINFSGSHLLKGEWVFVYKWTVHPEMVASILVSLLLFSKTT